LEPTLTHVHATMPNNLQIHRPNGSKAGPAAATTGFAHEHLKPRAALAAKSLAQRAVPHATLAALSVRPVPAVRVAPYVPAQPFQAGGEFSSLIQEFLDECDYAK
jgi:hypothetical protein